MNLVTAQKFIGIFMIYFVVVIISVPASSNESQLEQFISEVSVNELIPDADRYGSIRNDIPVIEAFNQESLVGWVFLTSDFVPTTGYSGKPIHTLVGVNQSAIITGVRLVKHSEPIILIGIPESELHAMTNNYIGIDLTIEAQAGGSAHDLDIISGATVSVIVIDDSIIRSGIKVARAMELGGLSADDTEKTNPFKIDYEKSEISDWLNLTGDGSIRRLSVDVSQINNAFIKHGDQRAISRPEPGPETDAFIDMFLTLVDVPSVGNTLLGSAEFSNLRNRLKEGEHALMLMGRGRYSFKGSGYVRGGIFDRIQLIQDDLSVRFHDRQHFRIGEIATSDAPRFDEIDVFIIPANSGFDPTRDFRLQLLVSRPVGPIEKSFLTFDLGYQLPEKYLIVDPVTPDFSSTNENNLGESDLDLASRKLWVEIWNVRKFDIVILFTAIGILTAVFFFQKRFTLSEQRVFWFRIGFLSFTLIWLGWVENAQLSIVNVLAFFSALTSEFSWDAFLLDPMVFLLWFSVAAALLFWGRGAYCGWLCPFGALQELTNRLAKLARIPQIEVPWGLHERLWPLKYIIFLGLFGLSLYSLELAERYSEVEPFKTAIILKFQRTWPFVVFAISVLVAGLFIERFYCRYLCPLGAALAIPARLRMFDWLKRYRECGNPCQRCANDCMVQAIHPEGNINPNECLNCLNCQVLYQHNQKCPVCIKKYERRRKFEERTGLTKQESNL